MLNLELARQLVDTQCPDLSHLSLRPVEKQGVDNVSFRLGDIYLCRFPSAKCYAEQVFKEQKFLPRLSQHLSIKIPTPVYMGTPGPGCPFHWSIYKWIEGKDADGFKLDIDALAIDLAHFLNELHAAPTLDAPSPGEHNFYRGGDLAVYNDDVQSALKKLKGSLDTKQVKFVWDRALSSKWSLSNVWIHGDLSPSNILILGEKLEAVIDFGCMGVGDPACDLVPYWNLFSGTSRETFHRSLKLGSSCFYRAQGWALWKALLNRLDEKGEKELLDEKIEDILFTENI